MEQSIIHNDPMREAQKEYKEQKDRFKFDIKIAVKEQQIIKKQANAKGGNQSPMSQSQAQLQRNELRHWYIAYAIFRQTYGGYKRFPEPYSLLIVSDGQLVAFEKDQKPVQGISINYINDYINEILKR